MSALMPKKKGLAALWTAIAVLVLLSPIGLILPELFNAGGAWGEWGTEEIEKISGYIPEGMKRLYDAYIAPAPDYAVRGLPEYVSYILSGLIGIVAVILLTYLIGRILTKNHGPRGPRFIEKTLRSVVSFTKDALFNRDTSHKDGFMQKIEPRVKIIGSMFFIVALSFVKEPSKMAYFLMLAFILAVLSKIPLSAFLRKLAPAFLFTLLIALPSTLNIFVEGKALIVLYKFGAMEVAITDAGLKSALGLILRVTSSVSMVFLLTMTTSPERLIKAVSSMLPGTLGSVFSISYRYIYFLFARVEEFITAYKARTPFPGHTAGRSWSASRMGALFSVSLRLSHDLELAMRSRGYRLGGREFAAEPFKPGFFDALWILFGGLMLWYGLI